LVFGLVWLVAHRREPVPPRTPDPTDPAAKAAVAEPPTPTLSTRPAVKSAPTHTGPTGAVHLEARWGNGAAELGHKLGEEAPEGPMSLAVGKKGDLWVLDQVNSRVQHFDAAGKLAGSIPVAETTQDLALGPHGELYTLDRIGKSEVIAYDAAGRALARDAGGGGPLHEGGAGPRAFLDRGGGYPGRRAHPPGTDRGRGAVRRGAAVRPGAPDSRRFGLHPCRHRRTRLARRHRHRLRQGRGAALAEAGDVPARRPSLAPPRQRPPRPPLRRRRGRR